MLVTQGHTVHIVEDGRKALLALEAGEYDVVIMDVQMPEMDGFEATRTIRDRERRSAGHIPIIALTAHAMKGDAERCLDAGMDGYLGKPISAAALQQMLASVARQRAAA
jgi:CheY-like chemotaxis protein